MRKELLILPLLVAILAGCVQLPGSTANDCGTDWSCFTDAVDECTPTKVIRTEEMDGMTLKLEAEIQGAGSAAGECKVRIHPLEANVPEGSVDDETKAALGFISFTDMTCSMTPAAITSMALTPEDLKKCEGTLADLLNEALVLPADSQQPQQQQNQNLTQQQNQNLTQQQNQTQQQTGCKKDTDCVTGNICIESNCVEAKPEPEDPNKKAECESQGGFWDHVLGECQITQICEKDTDCPAPTVPCQEGMEWVNPVCKNNECVAAYCKEKPKSNAASGSIILGYPNAYFNFKTGAVSDDWNVEHHIGNEPWCTESPGLCGNWVATSATALDAMTTPPTTGYISDGKGFEDCQNAPLNKVLVFKLDDGTYGKAIIHSDDYSTDTSGCTHTLVMDYSYPM